MDVVKSSCLETFKMGQYRGFLYLMLVVVPFQMGVWT